MLVTITGYSFNEGVVSIFAVDCERQIWDKQSRYVNERELEFQFITTEYGPYTYLQKWIHSQKCIKDMTTPSTWGAALHAVCGTVTNLNGKYLVWE